MCFIPKIGCVKPFFFMLSSNFSIILLSKKRKRKQKWFYFHFFFFVCSIILFSSDWLSKNSRKDKEQNFIIWRNITKKVKRITKIYIWNQKKPRKESTGWLYLLSNQILNGEYSRQGNQTYKAYSLTKKNSLKKRNFFFSTSAG